MGPHSLGGLSSHRSCRGGWDVTIPWPHLSLFLAFLLLDCCSSFPYSLDRHESPEGAGCLRSPAGGWEVPYGWPHRTVKGTGRGQWGCVGAEEDRPGLLDCAVSPGLTPKDLPTRFPRERELQLHGAERGKPCWSQAVTLVGDEYRGARAVTMPSVQPSSGHCRYFLH